MTVQITIRVMWWEDVALWVHCLDTNHNHLSNGYVWYCDIFGLYRSTLSALICRNDATWWIWCYFTERKACRSQACHAWDRTVCDSMRAIPLWSLVGVWSVDFEVKTPQHRWGPHSPRDLPNCDPSLCRCISLQTQPLSILSCLHLLCPSWGAHCQWCRVLPLWSTLPSCDERQPNKMRKKSHDRQSVIT